MDLRRLKGNLFPAASFSNGVPVVIDLCSGLGGLSLAAKQLNYHIIAGVDTNASAIKTFGKNFPEAKALEGSVLSDSVIAECMNTLTPYRQAGRPVIVVSGPPCQGFSAAGSRNPLDPRNRILVAVGVAISKLQPDYAIVENVSMLLANKNAERIQEFEKALQSGGYYVAHVVLNASEFGVPQKRKRAFFLVTKRPLDELAVIIRLESYKQEPRGAKEALVGLPTPRVRPDTYCDEFDYGGVHNHFVMRHSARVMEKIAGIEPGSGPMSYRRLHPTRLSNTLFSGHRAPPAHFAEPRSITVREAARLQGFTDDFRIYGSFANQMEQVTNAVPPPMAKAVIAVLSSFC